MAEMRKRPAPPAEMPVIQANWLMAGAGNGASQNYVAMHKKRPIWRSHPSLTTGDDSMANTDAKSRAAKAAAGTAEKTTAAARSATQDMTDAAFAYPKMEVPEVFRSFAEQGLTQTREAYARMKAAAEETTDLLEESFETTRDGVREAQLKVLDAAQANAEATF